MCVCVCVCVCVCMYVCVYVCMYVCVYVCVCVCVYVCIYVYVCMYVLCMYVLCVCVCVNRELDFARNYVAEIKFCVIEKACGMQRWVENCLQNFDHEETTYGSKHVLENSIKTYIREMGWNDTVSVLFFPAFAYFVNVLVDLSHDKWTWKAWLVCTLSYNNFGWSVA